MIAVHAAKSEHRGVTVRIAAVFAAVAISAVLASATAHGQDTAFTYQGQLKLNGNPASGSHDMQFTVYGVPLGGASVAGPICAENVDVTDGLFTVPLDFGAVFDGNERWLEIGVRADGTAGNCTTGGYTTLSTRQAMTGAPSALFASSAANATNSALLNGQAAAFYQNAGNISQGLLSPAFGGTGLNSSSASTGSLLYASGVGGWSLLPPGANTQVLTLAGGVPTWNNAAGLSLPFSGSASASFPDAAFKVTNSGTGYALAAQTGTGAYGLAHTDGGRTIATYVDGTAGWIGMRSNHPLKLMSNSTVAVLVDGGGRVGIGTLTPTNNLSVAGQADFASNVGIGTASPTSKLDVRGLLTIDAGGDAGIATGIGPSEMNRYVSLFNSLQFTSASGLKAGGVLVSDSYFFANPGKNDLIVKGNVGIGTAAPSQKLHVVGNICATGSIGACSDERFKTNVSPLAGALSIVERLWPVRFDWKREKYPEHQFSDQRQLGFIAQEVRLVLPEVVTTGSDGYLTVDYGRLTPVLVEAVKELKSENSRLRSELDELKRAVAELRGDAAKREAKR